MNRKTQKREGTFVLQATLPQEMTLASGALQERDEALGRFNDYCSSMPLIGGNSDFLGITEGVLLSEEAQERGYETEFWVLDSGMAPHERDWIAQEKAITVSVYFLTEKSAFAARSWFMREYRLVLDPTVEFRENEDWNAQWKASFQGIEVDEGLRILPPWHEDWLKNSERDQSSELREMIIAINPGAGFGTGTHETTQLCLGILKKIAAANGGTLNGRVVLDFGSGSGILGITAAKMGALVYCVEVDPMANDNAIENAQLNGVESRVVISTEIPSALMNTGPGNVKVDILLANILRPILLQFAPEILSCLKPHGELILSGLIESDLDQVVARYQSSETNFKTVEKLEKNEWRAIYLKR